MFRENERIIERKVFFSVLLHVNGVSYRSYKGYYTFTSDKITYLLTLFLPKNTREKTGTIVYGKTNFNNSPLWFKPSTIYTICMYVYNEET